MRPRLDALGLIAADLAATQAFYERLGCEFGPGPEHVEADLGGFRLMIDRADFLRELGSLSGPIGPRPGFALAVRLDSAQEVDDLYAELRSEDAVAPFDAPWGQRYATVHDPDGTAVDLYAWLPGQPDGVTNTAL